MTYLREQGSTLAKITIGEEYDEEVRALLLNRRGFAPPSRRNGASEAKGTP